MSAPPRLPPPVLRDVTAPAKLNLFLHVLGRRDDGYHLLQTVFRLIDLADTLHFARRNDGRVRRVTPLAGVPESACLTVNAALALKRATGCRYGVDIELDKRIPAGGGLGGGSSDAATVLLALNRLWGTGLSRAQLMRLALPLGADVPVFVHGSNAFAEGVGERLHSLRLPPAWYVVAQPNAHVSTAAVFNAAELTRNSSPVKMLDFPSYKAQSAAWAGERSDGGQALEASAALTSRFGRNDLEPVVYARFPVVALARQLVTQAARRVGGQAWGEVRMSGSGACLFFECESQTQAVAIEAEIAATIRQSDSAAKTIKAVSVCAGLDRHPLQHWVE